jgi:hypothetical protein
MVDPTVAGEDPEPLPKMAGPPPRPPTRAANGTSQQGDPEPGEIWEVGGVLTFRIIKAEPQVNSIRVQLLCIKGLPDDGPKTVFFEQNLALDWFIRDARLMPPRLFGD